MRTSLLAISNNEDDKRFAKEVGAICGLQVVNTSWGAENVRELAGSARMVLADIANENDLGLLRTACAGALNPNDVHAISSKAALAGFNPFRKDSTAGTLIVRNWKDVSLAARRFASLYKASMSGPPFGLERLMEDPQELQKLELTESMQRHFAATAVNDFLVENGCQGRIASAIANAVDELLMNAVFDAPINASGNQIFEFTPRNENIPLGGKSNVVMQLGSNHRYFAVSVTDFNGSVKRNTVLKHFTKAFNEVDDPEDARNPEAAGAGLGLSLIALSGGSMYFATKPGSRSEVTVMYDLFDQVRDFKQQFQFISTWISPS